MQGEMAGELAGPEVWETCRELIPAGSVFAFLAEHREVLFPAGMFADMYPSCRRSNPRSTLASVAVWLLLVSHTGMCCIRSLLLTGFDQDAQQYASRLRCQRGRFRREDNRHPILLWESVAIAPTIPSRG